MLFYIILITAAWLAYRHFAKKKRAADIGNWSVDFRNDKAIRPVTRRLPWKDL
jgi:hypothetical protein